MSAPSSYDKISGEKDSAPAGLDPPVPVADGSLIGPEVFLAFQQKDHGALALVIDRFHPPLTAFLRGMGNSPETAEEIALDAFMKLYQEAPKILGPERILPWLLVTSRRMALRDMTRRNRQPEVAVSDEVMFELFPSEGVSPLEAARLKELSSHLGRALEVLSEDDRELVSLRFFAGLKLREVADILSMPMGTVGVKLRRALDRLRRKLEESGFNYGELS